jgi:hypothetical protein
LTGVVVGAHGIRDPEDDRREHEGDDRCRQHTHSRFVLRELVVDREVDDEQLDGESDSAQRGAAEDAIEGESCSGLAEPRTPGERTRTEDAEELADDQAHDDSHVRVEPAASVRISGLSVTPALASANSGRMTCATYGT